MPLTVTQRPSITYDSKTSRWNAVANPIVYKMTRKDFITNTIVNSSGNLRVTVTGNITASVTVGMQIFFVSDNGSYSGVYTVSTVTFSSPDTTITFTGGYTVAGTTGYINLVSRLNYRVRVDLYNGSDVLLYSGLGYYPNSRGEVLIDVADPVENYISEDNTTAYTAFGQFTDTNYIQFYIQYTEVWIGSANSPTNDSANKFFAVGGGLQIGSSTGGNLAPYVIFNTLTIGARFLTTFTRPKIWRGFPWSVSALIDNPGVNTQLRIQWLDASGGVISTSTTTLASLDNSMRRFVIDPGTIPSNAVTASLRVQTGVPTALSQTLACDVVDPCDNPVLLIWRNSLGGDSLWCFDFNQEFDYRLNDTKNKRLKLFADQITLNEWEAINELNTVGETYQTPVLELTSSTNKTTLKKGQQVYQLASNGTKTGVIAIATENKTFSRQRTHNAEINILYPDIYVP